MSSNGPLPERAPREIWEGRARGSATGGGHRSGFLGVALAVLAAGCAPLPVPVSPAPISLGDWRRALEELAALGGRKTEDGPRTYKLALALREPVTGRRMAARGAVAIAPKERAVRMILVGPGGTTAFDLWIQADRFRVSIPAVDVLRRGDARTPKAEMRGLPVDFLRWWLLDPTRGELLWTEGGRYVLRDGTAITDLVVHANRGVEARRDTWSERAAGGKEAPVLLDEEKVTADRIGCGKARYTQASTGVEIEITCEGVEPNPPSERAFVDPDEAPRDEEEP
jgi:hypothetical protein